MQIAIKTTSLQLEITHVITQLDVCNPCLSDYEREFLNKNLFFFDENEHAGRVALCTGEDFERSNIKGKLEEQGFDTSDTIATERVVLELAKGKNLSLLQIKARFGREVPLKAITSLRTRCKIYTEEKANAADKMMVLAQCLLYLSKATKLQKEALPMRVSAKEKAPHVKRSKEKGTTTYVRKLQASQAKAARYFFKKGVSNES